MSIIHDVIQEFAWVRKHPGADRGTIPRYVAWNVLCAIRKPATIDLKEYGARFRCPPQRRGWAKLAYLFGEKCDEELPELRRFVRAGANVIDIGASIGIYTVALASLVGTSGSVISIEPSVDAFDALRQNVGLNGFENVSLVNAASGETMGTASLSLHRDPARSSIDGPSADSQGVDLVTVDSLVEERPIDFIKIDVEGYELMALRGAETVLREDRPIVQFESSPAMQVAHGYDPDQMWQFLVESHGYEILEGSNLERLLKLPSRFANLYAVHPEGPQPVSR